MASAAFRNAACHAARHGAQHCGDAGACALANLAAADAAEGTAGSGADAGLAAFQRHFPHGIDRRHAHGLLAPRFVLAVDVGRFVRDAARK